MSLAISIPVTPSTTTALPAGYNARPAEASAAAEVAELIAACETVLTGKPRTITESVECDWRGVDLDDESIALISPTGEIAAYADIYNRSYRCVSVYGYVHPKHTGRGLGTWLVNWGERWALDRMDHAPATARVVAQHYLRDENERAKQLLIGLGYTPVRTVYVMEICLSEPPADSLFPEGFRVRSFVEGQDEQKTYEAHEAAMGDMWERPPDSLENWVKFTKTVEPGLLLVVEETATGNIAGLASCDKAGEEGGVGGLGVVRQYRRRGVAEAMLKHAFKVLHERGARRVVLSVDEDSPTGASRVYSRAGMHVIETYHVYRKELRPGLPLGDVISNQ